MNEKKTVVSGVRLTPSQARKLDQIAEAMRVKRNTVIGILIETATDIRPATANFDADLTHQQEEQVTA